MPLERKIKAVLFDLDGTLIFHDQTCFLREYFKSISFYMSQNGIDPKPFVDATMLASGVVIANDGVHTNKALFWKKFFEFYGKYDERIIELSDEYYVTRFKNLRQHSAPNPNAKAAVDLAHKDGKKVVLATNPLFPMTAQIERMSWSGLTPEDFDLITSYENSNHCKPNPQYFIDVCKAIDVHPRNSLMIGNDEREDMKAAFEAGLVCYLATECRIPAKDYKWKGQQGPFEKTLSLLRKL